MIFMFRLLCEFYEVYKNKEMNCNYVSGFVYIIFSSVDFGYMK